MTASPPVQHSAGQQHKEDRRHDERLPGGRPEGSRDARSEPCKHAGEREGPRSHGLSVRYGDVLPDDAQVFRRRFARRLRGARLEHQIPVVADLP